MRSTRKLAASALLVSAALAVAACGGSSSGPPSSKGPVTLTWWHNGTTNPLLGIWQRAAAGFHAANHNVTLSVSPIQNEQFQTKIPVALQGNNPPDIYQQWGGGGEATQVKSGKLADLTSLTKSWIGEVGKAAQSWQVDGRQYGVPYDLHMVGFWYRTDLFKQAGITSPPATMADLNADVAKLKAAHIVPIAIGSKDRWPDAFWWEEFAVRECSTSVLQQAIKSINMSAPCFLKAGQDTTAFMKTNPFQTAFLSTPAQTGAGSSAGMVANGKAAMELQGDWEPGTMAALTPDKNLNSKLGWFPFPSVPGGAGTPGTMLGGGDGFTCTTGAAEPACADFLHYLVSPTVQKELVKAGIGLPVNPAAASAITSPVTKQVQQASQSAPYIQTYFDIAFPTSVGQALDSAVANFFAGQGTAQSIVQSVHQ
jgi:raffinose/stachyose/melibiose transport system substrate-binding protein